MRKKIVAGNWKMNNSQQEAHSLASEITAMVGDTITNGAEVVLAPPFIYLPGLVQMVKGSGIHIAAQNCAATEKGAFTGEVSAFMLQSIGVGYVIIGHSERRSLFHESDADVAAKLRQVLAHRLIPIVCVGETLSQRESGVHFEVVTSQLSESLLAVKEAVPGTFVVAYEPVWAIGTGKTASPEQAREMHNFIRQKLAGHFSPDAASQISLLYGGSCNEKNARELFAMPDIDGGLIGGASLKSDSFLKIIKSF
jgi:triosephosphate isomerase